jgi:3-deoxy-7-phosphoheptulonate synthase
MIIKFKKQAEPEVVQRLKDFLASKQCTIKDVSSEVVKIWGVIGDTLAIDLTTIQSFACVEEAIRITVPYKKTSRAFQQTDTVIDLGDGVIISKATHTVMAGPCSVESESQMHEIAKFLVTQGIRVMRGGAFKPRTSPYAFQGLMEDGLKLLRTMGDMYKLKIISEIPSADLLPMFEQYVDIIQVGARNMQNFHLLKALGKSRKPIFLKRGLSSTIEEWLMSAEYILHGGNDHVILCERGIRTFETYTRNTLDLNAVLAVKELSHLPVFIDPSHATGRRSMIGPLAKTALAVEAHGQIIEIHPRPEEAWSDGAQSLTFAQFETVMKGLKELAPTFKVSLQ